MRVFFILIAIVSVAGHASAQLPFKVRFESPSYSAFDNTVFTAKILVDPVPARKLFSYGLLVKISGSNGLVGTGAIASIPEFNFNGPLDDPALTGEAVGFAAIKGTGDYFSDIVPRLLNKNLATFTLQPLPPGDYSLTLLPYYTLGATEQLFVRGDLGVSDHQITFGTSLLHVAQSPGTVTPIGPLVVDPQSRGLLTQTIRLTTTLTRTPVGLRVFVDNVPAVVTVFNAHGKISGRPYLDYLPALPPGQTVDLLVEFFPKDRKTIPSPKYVLAEINPPEIPPVTGPTQQIQPRLKLSNGFNLLEFSTSLNVTYYIQYSSDLQNWKTAQPAVLGTGTTAQWIDDGPPRTESKPNQGVARYYRIVTPE